MRDLISGLARPMLRLLGRDEKGAIGVLVVVVIGGGVLLGMGALTIDVGRLYQNRAELQNGADAAALAVAKSCASGTCNAGLAAGYANANASNLTAGQAAVDLVCGTGSLGAGCVSPLLACPANPAPGTNYVDVRTSTGAPGGLLPPIFARTLQPAGFQGLGLAEPEERLQGQRRLHQRLFHPGTHTVRGQHRRAEPGGQHHRAQRLSHRGLTLASQQLPASSVPSSAVHSITPDISSLVMSANVPAGQLLLRPMLVTAAQATGAGTLAIPKGMVAVTIPLCLPEAVAGYIQPGSQVAVFDTYSTTKLNVQENCSGTSQTHSSSAQGPVLTRVVLPRVLVLSVGSAPVSGTSGTSGSTTSAEASSTTASTSGPVLVTMAVNQANAERLILLTETGVSYLALLTPSSHTAFDAATSPVFHP